MRSRAGVVVSFEEEAALAAGLSRATAAACRLAKLVALKVVSAWGVAEVLFGAS
jgi:hypothetical protein